jgi:formylglycine-generating enzyme required for sulfatase activity
LPIGTVLAGDVRIVSLVDDGALGYTYGVETGAGKERAQLVELCPRGLASRAPDGAVFAATAEAAELLKLCLERFVRDAEILRTHRHPSLQPVLAVLAANGTACALQPPEQAKTLAAVANSLQRLPSQAEIDKIVGPLVSGLAMLHARGLFHANITPETILLGSGIEPTLVRYGGTRALFAARTRTVHAAVTPGYSAPELYLFDESGHGALCDVFSLAAVLYRLVTGRTPADVIQRSLGEVLPPAARTQGQYRAGLLQAIDAGLSLDPKKRPQTMAALGAMLLGEAAPASATAPAAAARPVEMPTAAAPIAPPAKAEAAKPAAPQPAASTAPKDAPKPSGDIAKPAAGTEAKPQLAVVPKPEVDERTLKPGSARTASRGGLRDMLPGSYRLVGLGMLLAAALATGMWQLDRQLNREGKAQPPAQAAAPTTTTSEAAKPKPAASEPAVRIAPERPKADDAEKKRAAEMQAAARQQAAEARASAERRQAEERAAAERRAAEERAAAEKQKAADAERERQQKEQQARAEEEARAADAARQQKARLEAIATATDRDIVLALRTGDPSLEAAIGQRLAALGYLNVITSAGDKWLRPGDGEPFRDCDTCPEMVLVPPPVRVASAPPKPSVAVAASNVSQQGGGLPLPSAAIAVGRTEITRDEFAAFVADTGYDTSGGCHARIPDWKLEPALSWSSPGFAQDGRHPAVCVSFSDSQAYAAWLASRARQPYRLPTEAEWEHAARSNTATALRFPFGNDEREICKHANGADESARAAFPGWQVAGCSDGFTHTAPAGTFKPNHFGLHDTMGNAWEWVDECAPPPGTDGVVRKADCTASSPRILKGGSYSDRPELLEPQARTGAEPHTRDEIAGFRIMRPVEVRAAATTAQK